MTLQEVIELTQQHFPDMGEAEIIKLINRAQDNIAVKSRLLSDEIVVHLKSGEPYYEIEDNIISINNVTYDNDIVPRLNTLSVDGINFSPDEFDDLLAGDVYGDEIIDLGDV